MKLTNPATTPSLDALAGDVSLISSLSPPALSQVYVEAARLEAALRARLSVLAADRPTEKEADGVLTIREAADLLRVSRDSLYRKWRRLDFAYRDGLDGRVKFSRRGVERYVDHHLQQARI